MDGKAEDRASVVAEDFSTGDLGADDDHIAKLQREVAWDEVIDAELSQLLTMQDIRENAESSTTDPDAVQLSSSSVATCIADAVRRASESLSLQPFSNIWEQGVFWSNFHWEHV